MRSETTQRGRSRQPADGKKGRGTFGYRLVTALLVLLLLAGVALLLYPGVSRHWNGRRQRQTVVSYDTRVGELAEEDCEALLEEAETYNRSLQALGSAAALSHPSQLEDYDSILDISGTGIMGYVSIPMLNLKLPIYHGTDSSVLAAGAGHLKGSSFPIGGKGTHAVISAHRGLPSARLFTNLDRMKVGDTFTITVLDRVLTYQVDQITVVLPSQAENLYIDNDKDYCTLMTCTPYGINSHRLLVRGVRVDTTEGGPIRITPETRKIGELRVAGVLTLPLFTVAVILILACSRRERRNTVGKEHSDPHDHTKGGNSR